MESIKRKDISVREGYDKWADSYDLTKNPLVALDNRYTMAMLPTSPGTRILDAGCGTGRHFSILLKKGYDVVGIDFSEGMLRIARKAHPEVPTLMSDLHKPLPFVNNCFNVILCALVGEHLLNLTTLFQQFARVLKGNGTLLFSVFHPELAFAGIEANFQHNDVEYRLGAEKHTVRNYLDAVKISGFNNIRSYEYNGDHKLVKQIPEAEKYLGVPMLLIIQANSSF